MLRKRRNKERGDRRRAEFRCRDKEPAKKKRRVDPMDQGGEERPGEQEAETEQRPEKSEKRKPEQTEGPKKKQMRIDTYLRRGAETKTLVEKIPGEQENHEQNEPEQNEPPIENKLGLDEDLVYDWAKIFEAHSKIVEEERRVRAERLDRADKLNASWELARLCKEYIRQNSNSWRAEKPGRGPLNEQNLGGGGEREQREEESR